MCKLSGFSMGHASHQEIFLPIFFICMRCLFLSEGALENSVVSP